MNSAASSSSTLSYSALQESKKKWQKQWIAIWKDYASNTTLHGPFHITSTTKHWRTYYIVIFISMSCLFVGHMTFLIYQYLQFPINTDVKFQNVLYAYPDLTICPNSATSQYLINKSKPAEDIYKSTRLFWENKKVNRESTSKMTKRSFLKNYYLYAKLIGRLPHQHIIWCQINDQSCLDQIIITEHPTYYRCFTLRPNARSILAGPTHGITLLLHRADPSLSLLQLNEEDSYEKQASVNNATLNLQTGFIIGFHERGSYPNFQLTALPAVIKVKFGEKLRISLDLTSLKAANLKTRPCKMTSDVPPTELIKLDPESASNSNSNGHSLIFSYIRQSCIAIKRQELIFKQCGCFSEEYHIPYHMLSQGSIWCFDVEGQTNKIVKMDSTITCVNDINKMTENEVLFDYLKKDSKPSFLKTFSVCPLRCDRFIHLIHSVFKDQMTHSISMADFQNYFEHLKLKGFENPFLNVSSIVHSKDVVAIDISAVSEHVNEVIETRAFDRLSLISQIGGISGLYVGVTMFTVFEMLDLLYLWLSDLFPLFFNWVKWKTNLVQERFQNKF